MRYVRFMSIEELKKYLRGEKLKNNTVWKDEGYKTDAVGFCFFDDSEPLKERRKYCPLAIPSNMNVWAVFEQIGGEPLRKCTATYRDPKKDNVSLEQIIQELAKHRKFPDIPTMWVTEYSTPEYSQETLKLVAVGCESYHGIHWLSRAEMKELLRPQYRE